mmetsp:Transcript_13309/g.27959  ORF Transcript_13309/g.27959 Transcript_13309/m.27959 type:complete len:99 (-) Transcript_13309:336-632(-)
MFRLYNRDNQIGFLSLHAIGAIIILSTVSSIHGYDRETVIASQTQRVVNAFMKVRGSFSQVVAVEWHSSSSPSTVAITIKSNEVGIRHRIMKWTKLAL